MASTLDNLKTAHSQIAANLVEITLKPKPTYSIDGENVSWESLVQMYTNQLLVLEQAIQRATGPFQIATRMQS
jgi:hypothetical protein